LASCAEKNFPTDGRENHPFEIIEKCSSLAGTRRGRKNPPMLIGWGSNSQESILEKVDGKRGQKEALAGASTA